jgi:hypothetical protein
MAVRRPPTAPYGHAFADHGHAVSLSFCQEAKRPGASGDVHSGQFRRVIYRLRSTTVARPSVWPAKTFKN